MVFLTQHIGDYPGICQGKTRIPGVNDGEEFELTDVSYVAGDPRKKPQRITDKPKTKLSSPKVQQNFCKIFKIRKIFFHIFYLFFFIYTQIFEVYFTLIRTRSDFLYERRSPILYIRIFQCVNFQMLFRNYLYAYILLLSFSLSSLSLYLSLLLSKFNLFYAVVFAPSPRSVTVPVSHIAGSWRSL